MVDVDVLKGSRVTLRAPRLDDAEELFASVASDPEVTRYVTWPPHPDVSETQRVIAELFNVGKQRTWITELQSTGEVIGTCGFRVIEPHIREFGYVLGRRWWGQQLIAEVVDLLLTEMARDPKVRRISAVCHVDNTRSARVLARAGLTMEGRLLRHTVFPNLGPEPQDVLQFGTTVP